MTGHAETNLVFFDTLLFEPAQRPDDHPHARGPRPTEKHPDRGYRLRGAGGPADLHHAAALECAVGQQRGSYPVRRRTSPNALLMNLDSNRTQGEHYRMQIAASEPAEEGPLETDRRDQNPQPGCLAAEAGV